MKKYLGYAIVLFLIIAENLNAQQNLSEVKDSIYSSKIENSFNEKNERFGLWNTYDSLGNYCGVKEYLNDSVSAYLEPKTVYYNNSNKSVSLIYNSYFAKEQLKSIQEVFFYKDSAYYSFCFALDSLCKYIMTYKDSRYEVNNVDTFYCKSNNYQLSKVINHSYEDSVYKFQIGTVLIYDIKEFCCYTDIRNIKINTESGDIIFRGFLNAFIFENTIGNHSVLFLVSLGDHGHNVRIYKVE